MTINEAVGLIKNAKEITIAYGGTVQTTYIDNEMFRAAYGDFVIDGIYVCATDNDEVTVELDLKCFPVKAGATNG
ncbi:MAG: hypothetical protein ACI4I6_09595 [Hominimerdicola sp.]